MKQASLKRKRPKTKPTISPTANSRAGSETTKVMDDDDQADSRSASGSVRGQTRSRDLTPTLQTSTENYLLGDSELSAREKRKIAAAEKKFQQLEQDQQATNKRKKRASGQSSHGRERQSHSPPAGTLPGPLPSGRHGSPRKMSNSHSIPSVQFPLGRPQYVDSAIQTEPEAPIDGISSSPTPRRPSFVPLTQRLLKRCYFDRIRFEKSSQSISPPTKPVRPLDSPPASLSPLGGLPFEASIPSTSGDKNDADMKDADSPIPSSSSQAYPAQLETSSLDRGMVKPPLPPPWPSTAAHNARIPLKTVSQRRPELHVRLPPMTIISQSSAPSPGSAPVSTSLSPSADAPPQPALPALASSSIVAPSPVKKKLSLGDYIIRRGTKATPSVEKTQLQTTGMPSTTPAASGPVHSNSPGDIEATKGDDRRSQDMMMKDIPGPTPASHLSSLTR